MRKSDSGAGQGDVLQHADLDEVLAAVPSTPEGLTSDEAAARLQRDGPKQVLATLISIFGLWMLTPIVGPVVLRHRGLPAHGPAQAPRLPTPRRPR